MTRRVRTELDSSSREFSNYRRVSNQMLEEGFEEIARQAERNGEEIRKSIESLSKDAIKPIQDAAEKLSLILDGHAKAVDAAAVNASVNMTEVTSKLADIITTFGNSVEAVGRKLEELRLPEDSPSGNVAQIETAMRPIRNIESKLDRVLEALEREVLYSHTDATAVARRIDGELEPVISIPDHREGEGENEVSPPSDDDKIGHEVEDLLKSVAHQGDEFLEEETPETKRRWFNW
jgi:uncharacterized protein Yka (UPF0111/DUF47 family)